MFNPSIEAMCDFIQPDYHKKIGIIKDLAATGLGLAIFTWLIVLIIEIIEVLDIFKFFGFFIIPTFMKGRL